MTESKKCTECGLCRNSCPLFILLKKETISPRGKAKLLKENINDEIFFACTLCKSCTVACPLGLELGKEFIEQRAKLEKENKTTKANKLLIENVRKYGNPLGKIEEGKIPKELFCC
ncbi:MAG: (Fe-S)-binding protein [Nanoarchaeota archaeon]|nr:(Fe-S)-binding protein [Nanoarchaeota archaeon]